MEEISLASDVLYTKYQLALILLIRIVYGFVVWLFINLSISIVLQEILAQYPGLIVDIFPPSPILLIYDGFILLFLLLAKTRNTQYLLLSISCATGVWSLMGFISWLDIDRYQGGLFTFLFGVILVCQMLIILNFGKMLVEKRREIEGEETPSFGN